MFEKTMQRLAQNQKGAMSGAVGAVVVVVVGTAIGYFVVVTVLGGISREQFTAAQNTTFTTLQSNTDSAITLLAILAIVVAASAILASFG